MRRLFLVVLFLYLSSGAMGQTVQPELSALQITAGLGIDEISSNSLFSYINTLYEQQLTGLIPATEFFIVPEFQITDSWFLGIEYSYLLCSKSNIGPYAGDFTESVHMPMFIAHYCLHGEGYWFKFGGGVGYNIGTLAQTVMQGGTEQTYTAHGVGMKLDAVMNLAFDDHLYGMLCGDVRWCAGSTFANGGTDASYQSVSPKLSFVTVGLKLGMMYQF
jgi:hypothetical protein